ncbi:hypothetical protein SNEBB_004942 [Seison nebaliae]|nr:hypothetical protein SNEBB_004942 [Seison nebaliae]
MIIEEIDKEPSDAISEDDHTFQEISTKNSDSLSTINASFTQFNLDDLIQNNGVGNECYIDNSDILHRFDTENECDEDEENNKSDRCFTESFGNEPIEEIIENNKIEEITNVPNNSNNNSIMKIVAKAIHDKFDNVDPSNFFMRAPEKRIMINEPRKTFSNQVCQTESDKTIDGHDKFSEIDPVCIISPFEFHNDMNDNGHSGLHEITNENFSTEICNRPQLQPTLLECELEQKVQHQPRIDHKFIERNNLNKNKLHKDKFQLQDTFRKKRRPQRQFQKMKMPPNKLQQSSFNGNNFNKLVEHMPQHSRETVEEQKGE